MSALFADAAFGAVTELAAAMSKTTMVLVAAGAVVTLWRGASAAHRHTVWLAALIACGIAVVASPWLPATQLHVRSSPRVVAVARILGVEAPPDSRVARANPDRATAVVQPAARPSSTARATVMTPQRWAAFVGVAWAIGFISILIRIVGGVLSVRRHGRLLRSVDDAAWLTELRRTQTLLGVKREIALKWGGPSTTPAAFGIRRPTIVIPAEANGWSAEQRQVVLVHEVAHIARGDIAAQLAARIVYALLWFQPLIWLAFHRLRAEAESAADDCVLFSGVAASAYAARLLEFARASTPPARLQTPVVGMFTDSNLERRFTAMLDTTRSRASTSRGMRRAAAVLAIAGGAGVAATRFAAPATALPLPKSATATEIPFQPRSALLPIGHPASAPTALTVGEVTAGDTLRPVVATAPLPQTAATPDLSGTWIPDTATIPLSLRLAYSKLVVTIAQNDNSIWIAQRGPIRELFAGWSGSVGGYPDPDGEASALIHLDGAPSEESSSWAQHNVVISTIAGAWDGRDLVTTARRESLERAGIPWRKVDRWTRASDSTLIRAIMIVVGAQGTTAADTVAATIQLRKAR